MTLIDSFSMILVFQLQVHVVKLFFWLEQSNVSGREPVYLEDIVCKFVDPVENSSPSFMASPNDSSCIG